jgi:hypothetical protein
MVGCTQPVVMAWMVATASRPPAAPRQCPIMDLVPFILMWLQSENTCAMAAFMDLNHGQPFRTVAIPDVQFRRASRTLQQRACLTALTSATSPTSVLVA